MAQVWKKISSTVHKSIKDIENTLYQNRGLATEDAKKFFQNPSHPADISLKDLNIDKKDLKIVLERINKAKRDKESIVIYTDYDVDGILGGTILWEGLYEYGLKVMPYVPERKKEGYGLGKIGIDNIKKAYNPSLIITIDNGISAQSQIQYAKDCGIETIVLDHHTKGNIIDAKIVHTTKICATSIAWYVINNLTKIKKPESAANLDLCALATVSDCMPLQGVGRSLVVHGLDELRKTKRIGLNALIKQAGIKKEKIGVFDIGFILGPRINAMGRIAHALDSLRLMCTKDIDRAEKLAFLLNQTNKSRQQASEIALKEAIDQYKNSANNEKIIAISGQYNPGIIGLVAGKLAEIFYKPAIVISETGPLAKASMRSIPGVNITEMVRSIDNLLENVGGHPMAGGFTVEKNKIPSLIKRLYQIAESTIDPNLLIKSLSIDCPLIFDLIGKDLLTVVSKLSPYGIGNPEPVFATERVTIINAKKVGSYGQHLKVQFANKNDIIDGIGFGLGDRFKQLKKNMDIAYSLEENHWNGKTSLQLNIKDVNIPNE